MAEHEAVRCQEPLLDLAEPPDAQAGESRPNPDVLEGVPRAGGVKKEIGQPEGLSAEENRQHLFVQVVAVLPDTLQVRSVVTEDQLSHHNTLAFEVRAKLWSMPYPLELLLRSNLDLETGHVVLQEQTGPAG